MSSSIKNKPMLLEMKDPIFVIGLPRSGSTLWENIIAESPGVLRLAEMLFLTPWRRDFRYFVRKNVGSLSDDRNIEKMVTIMFGDKTVKGITGSFWRFGGIDAAKDPGFKKAVCYKIKSSNRSLGSIFKIIIEELTRFSGCERCSVAFPVYPNHISKLLEWYPKCKIVCVTRDPRAIAISKTNDPSGTAILLKKYPLLRFFIRKVVIFFVIVQYIWLSRIHNNYKKINNYRLFRYEDLLIDPENEIRRLCQFIDVDFVPQMLSPKEAMESSVSGVKPQGFSKNSARHWGKKITFFEKLLVTGLTKRSMKKFGFDPQAHPIYRTSPQS